MEMGNIPIPIKFLYPLNLNMAVLNAHNGKLMLQNIKTTIFKLICSISGHISSDPIAGITPAS